MFRRALEGKSTPDAEASVCAVYQPDPLPSLVCSVQTDGRTLGCRVELPGPLSDEESGETVRTLEAGLAAVCRHDWSVTFSNDNDFFEFLEEFRQ
jgi:hypothetical protein